MAQALLLVQEEHLCGLCIQRPLRRSGNACVSVVRSATQVQTRSLMVQAPSALGIHRDDCYQQAAS